MKPREQEQSADGFKGVKNKPTSGEQHRSNSKALLAYGVNKGLNPVSNEATI